MKNIFKIAIVVAVLTIFCAGPAYAQTEADASASIKMVEPLVQSDYRVLNLKNYLKNHNSPLAEYSAEFVGWADFYEMDYRLVPAIAGVESTFGKRIPYNSYNAYGWANGEYRFSSWEDSIEHVNMTLKTKYIDKGAPTINKIARRYAPPSTTWARNVRYFVAKIDRFPVSFDI